MLAETSPDPAKRQNEGLLTVYWFQIAGVADQGDSTLRAGENITEPKDNQ
jgi:hypothetical protein